LVNNALFSRDKTTKAALSIDGEQQHRAVSNILDLEGGEATFSGITSKELLKTLLMLQMVSFEPVVDLSIKTLTSPLMQSPLFQAPLHHVVKRTTYSHFCAGEDVADASATLERLWQLGLRGVFYYGMEDAVDNASCDKNFTVFLQVINQSSKLPPDSVSFGCVKISAICPIQLLEHVSSLLRWQHKNKEFKLPWNEKGLPILAAESPTHSVQTMPEPLTKEEEHDWTLAHQRLWKLCRACEIQGMPLVVDAEYMSLQPAIDTIVYAAMLEFNKGCPPVVYGTFQAYLKDTKPRLSLALKGASEHGISLGVKLVRGAYITRETAVAASYNVPSPIHPSIQETHRCYDECAAIMLEEVANGKGSLLVGTHNVNSGKAAASKLDALGLSRSDPRVQFAQLMGMADVLSLGLAQAGFRVNKFLAFGPVSEAISFLVRRAEENRGMLGNTLLDRRCIRKELQRRFQQLIRI